MHIFKNKKTGYVFADIIAIALMMAWAFWLNQNIRVSGLYMDDLYLWSCYGEQSFTEFVFPVGSTRFRPIFWMAAYIELALIKTNLALIVPINLIILVLIAVYCYRFFIYISDSRLVAFFGCMAIIASRFSYYDVGQLLGLLESLSMFFAIFICIELYYFMHDKKEYHYILSIVAYILVSFTHERYMVLIPMFFYVMFVLKEKKIVNYFLPVAAIVLVLGLRLKFIGTLLPAGTGGTDVAETFTIASFIQSCKDEIKYMLGFNPGPEHLCGIEWSQVTDFVKKGVYIGIAIIALLSIIFIIKLIANANKGNASGVGIRDVIFFGGFIIGCVVASSVTIRVEMRWIYTSFVIMLFVLAYMVGYIARSNSKSRSVVGVAAFALICILFIGEDLYYRQSWDKIYLFPNQDRYNSLADVTYGTYGDEIFGKDIYIIGNSYEMSEFTGDTFFKTFDPERKAEGTRVIHVESMDEIPEGNRIILKEDPENNAFVEVK